MACSYCKQKGYIEGLQSYDAEIKSDVKVCPKCNDIKAYSKYVKEQMFGFAYTPEKPIVIDFAKARKKRG